MKKIKNLCRIRLKGLNQERTISNISKSCKLYNLNRIEKSISEVEVNSKDLKKVKAQLMSSGLEVEILKVSGIGQFIKRFLSFYGVIAAIVLSIGLYIFQYGYVWQIKVFGTEKLNDSEIVSFIEQNFNKHKSQIETENVELLLKENFKRISAVSVAIVGQTLVVNIYETIYPIEMEGQFSPIYAEVDCKIISTDLIQGTLCVKVGDIVRRGEVLVQPFIIDSQGQKREVVPEAKIEAEVWLIGKAEHYDSYYKTERTGKKIECGKVKLFGLEIYNNCQENTFLQSECEENSVFLSKNQILPLIYEKTVYYETKTQLIEQSFEEVKIQKVEEAKQNALIYLQEKDIIKEEIANIKSLGGVTNLEYVVTVRRNIGVNFETLHKES